MVYHPKQPASKSLHPRARLNSIGFALRGIRRLIIQEPNARLHLIASMIAVTAGIFRHINATNWLAIVIAIALVWLAEAFNTAIELLCDLWCGGAYHPRVKVIKDISAGAVLIAAMASASIAVFVFFF